MVVSLDLAPYRNCVGCTWPGVTETTGLDGFGRTLPAEELDALPGLLGSVAAEFGHGVPDNVACEGQTVTLPRAIDVHAWSILGACDGGSMRDTFGLSAGPGNPAVPVAVGLTDFLGIRPSFDDEEAVSCTHMHADGRDVPEVRPRLWRATGTLARPVPADRLLLPMNPGVHVFAVSLTGSTPSPKRWS